MGLVRLKSPIQNKIPALWLLPSWVQGWLGANLLKVVFRVTHLHTPQLCHLPVVVNWEKMFSAESVAQRECLPCMQQTLARTAAL